MPAGRSAPRLATSRRKRGLKQSLSPPSWRGEALLWSSHVGRDRRARRRPPPRRRVILSVNNIEVIYDHVILVLKGVSLDVPKGGIVALLGANGAGKTTTLKAISNLLHAERGDVTKGSIVFEGDEVQDLSPNELVRRGCIQVMEGRQCFAPSHHRGKPADRRLHPPRRQGRDPARPRSGLCLFPQARRAQRRARRLHLRRRAADVRHRPRADVAAEDDPARRAVDGAGAADRRGDFRDRQRPQREGRRLLPAGRAEHPHGAAIRALRLHPGKRPRGDGRRSQGAAPRTRTSRNSTSASPKASASRSATASITGAASAGWRRFRRCPITTTLWKPAIRPSASATLFAGLPRDRRARHDGAGLGQASRGRRSEIRHLARGAGETAGAAQEPISPRCKRTIRRSAASMSRRPARPSACKCRRARCSSRKGTAPISAHCARALFAAGFRAGDIVHNSFSYHLTPGAYILEAGAHGARLRRHSRRRRQYRAAA